jgi:ABC-type branched-subunit amino acid transport system ATPase component
MFAVFAELKPFANVLGWKLSGGRQEMLAIARGLMANQNCFSSTSRRSALRR